MTHRDVILSTLENGIQKVVLNKPARKNAISKSMYEQLTALLNETAKNDKVLIFVLTGSGDFFSSGNDISSFMTEDVKPTTLSDANLSVKNFIDALILYPKLLIAIVNGPAIGIATTMLGMFDMVYASSRAYFQTPFTSLGLVAEGCSSYIFPRLLGHSKAGDVLYLGYKLSAQEAKQRGFISEVYNHESLEKVWNRINEIPKLSAESILAIKRLTTKWNRETLLRVNAEEMKELAKRCESSDLFERILNFFAQKNKL